MNSKNKSNKTIPSAGRTIILRVLHFFEEEKRRGSHMFPVDQVLARTCAATGVSVRTVRRIKNEEKAITQTISPTLSTSSTSSPEGATMSAISLAPTSTTSIIKKESIVLPTPGKKRRKRTTKVDVDDITLRSIKNIILSFQNDKKEVPTLNKILAVAKAELDFSGQKETLRKIIVEKLGYSFIKSTLPPVTATKVIKSELIKSEFIKSELIKSEPE